MNGVIFILTFAAAIGSAVVAGIFFAFSTFVMTALGRIPVPAGIAAMQSINRAVLNRAFLTAFLGTAGISLVLAAMAPFRWSASGTPLVLAGGLLYLCGSLLVTIRSNVPMNDALARVTPESTEGAELWARYLVKWTAWNHVRTAGSLAASAAFIAALCRQAAG